MPRQSNGNGLSIVELERMLQSRRSRLSVLERKRSKLLRRLEALDSQITHMGGASHERRPRPKQAQPQRQHRESPEKACGPVRVGDIAQNVLHAGYSTNSDNFRVIVNQALIKDKRFAKGADRGTYLLKK